MQYKFSEILGRAIVPVGLSAIIGRLPLFAASPSSRLSEGLDSGRTFALPGAIQPLLASAADEGEVEPSLLLPRITMHFKMTDAQQVDLDRLLQVLLAFETGIRRYRVNGKLHHANSSDPVLPRALEGVVSGIRGLSDFHPRPHGIRSNSQPRFTSNLSGNHFIAPGDFAVIYDVQPLYNSGIDGTFQKIAIAGQTDIKVSDIEAFQAASGLPIKDPQIILDGTDPGIVADDLTEADLDIEWAGAVARGATIVFVNSQDALTSAIYAIGVRDVCGGKAYGTEVNPWSETRS